MFAIVVTKQAIDWFAVNNAITKSTQAGYAAKVADALQQNAVSNVRFATGTGGTINFKADNAQQNAVLSAPVGLPQPERSPLTAVVGVRADGFAAEQSPTTQHSILVNKIYWKSKIISLYIIDSG